MRYHCHFCVLALLQLRSFLLGRKRETTIPVWAKAQVLALLLALALGLGQVLNLVTCPFHRLALEVAQEVALEVATEAAVDQPFFLIQISAPALTTIVS